MRILDEVREDLNIFCKYGVEIILAEYTDIDNDIKRWVVDIHELAGDIDTIHFDDFYEAVEYYEGLTK